MLRVNGFYSQLVEPGLRIVSLNNNFCAKDNFWIYLNTTDPAGLLEWLIGTLQDAEDKKEKVYLIGHIPSGIADCISSWSDVFYEIVNRYESTIIAHFYGHTRLPFLF